MSTIVPDGTDTQDVEAIPGVWLGGIRGTVAAAYEFGREISRDWKCRVVVRVTGRRDQIPPNWHGPGEHDGPSWDIYAAERPSGGESNQLV